ncbi:hypothetical protein D3C79_856890 [compost metagenome]
MYRTTSNGDIDKLVQRDPASTEFANGPIVGSKRQRHQKRQTDHAYGDEGSADDICNDSRNAKCLIQHHINSKMHQHIIECEKAKRASITQQADASDIADRCYEQCQDKEAQSPKAERVFKAFDRICTELVCCPEIKGPQSGKQAEDIKSPDLQFINPHRVGFGDGHVSNSSAGPFQYRAMLLPLHNR